MAFIRNAQRSAAVVFVHNIWESLGLINVSTSRNFNLFVWEQNCYSWPDHQTLLFISDPKHCCFALKFPLILFSFICCADGWCAVICLMCAVVGCEALNKMLSIPSPGPASSYNKYNSLDRCYNVLQYHNVAIQTNWIQYSRTQWAGQTGVTFNTQPWTWASEALHSQQLVLFPGGDSTSPKLTLAPLLLPVIEEDSGCPLMFLTVNQNSGPTGTKTHRNIWRRT